MLSCWSAWLAGSVSQSFVRPIYQGMGWLVGWSVSRCGLMTHWFADCIWLPIVCCSGMPVWVGIVMRYRDYAWINGTAFPPTYPCLSGLASWWDMGIMHGSMAQPSHQHIHACLGWHRDEIWGLCMDQWHSLPTNISMPVWVGIVMRYGDYAWINGTAFPPTYPCLSGLASWWDMGTMHGSMAQPSHQHIHACLGWHHDEIWGLCMDQWHSLPTNISMPVWVGIVMRYGDYAWINGTAFPPTYPCLSGLASWWDMGTMHGSMAQPSHQHIHACLGWHRDEIWGLYMDQWHSLPTNISMPVWVGIVMRYGNYAWINGTAFPPTYPCLSGLASWWDMGTMHGSMAQPSHQHSHSLLWPLLRMTALW